MAKFKVTGLDMAFNVFGELSEDTEDIAKMCVYDGAGVVADAVKKNIEALPERDPKKRGTEKHKVKGVTPDEKAALAKGFGIAKIRANGNAVDTVLGFDGYTGDPTPNYPKGKPISMIARANESGTSWLTKSPFLKTAYNSSKEAAESAMANRFDEEIKKRS